jgi:alkylated DNA nucleotide flippase Atl1
VTYDPADYVEAGSAVPWHRVVTASGRTPPGHEVAARKRLTAEGVTFRGAHVDMGVHAWFPAPAPASRGRQATGS